MTVLSQLTEIGEVTKKGFEERFDWMFPANKDTYTILVIVDRRKDAIVGTATLIFQRKFTRSLGLVSYSYFHSDKNRWGRLRTWPWTRVIARKT